MQILQIYSFIYIYFNADLLSQLNASPVYGLENEFDVTDVFPIGLLHHVIQSFRNQ